MGAQHHKHKHIEADRWKKICRGGVEGSSVEPVSLAEIKGMVYV